MSAAPWAAECVPDNAVVIKKNIHAVPGFDDVWNWKYDEPMQKTKWIAHASKKYVWTTVCDVHTKKKWYACNHPEKLKHRRSKVTYVSSAHTWHQKLHHKQQNMRPHCAAFPKVLHHKKNISTTKQADAHNIVDKIVCCDVVHDSLTKCKEIIAVSTLSTIRATNTSCTEMPTFHGFQSW